MPAEISNRHLENRRAAARDLARAIVLHNRKLRDPMTPEQLRAAFSRIGPTMWKQLVESTGRMHLPSIETRMWAIDIACAYSVADQAIAEIADAQHTLASAAVDADRLLGNEEARQRARVLDKAVTAALHNINRAYSALVDADRAADVKRSA